jgi:hypothetical protein
VIRGNACDYWTDRSYCGAAITRRYMNGWRCIKHTPALIRAALAKAQETAPQPLSVSARSQ